MPPFVVIALNWAQSPTFPIPKLWASTWVSPVFLIVFKFGKGLGSQSLGSQLLMLVLGIATISSENRKKSKCLSLEKLS